MGTLDNHILFFSSIIVGRKLATMFAPVRFNAREVVFAKALVGLVLSCSVSEFDFGALVDCLLLSVVIKMIGQIK